MHIRFPSWNFGWVLVNLSPLQLSFKFMLNFKIIFKNIIGSDCEMTQVKDISRHVWVKKGVISGLDIKVVSLVMILGKCLVNRFYCHIWLIAPNKVTGTILSVIWLSEDNFDRIYYWQKHLSYLVIFRNHQILPFTLQGQLNCMVNVVFQCMLAIYMYNSYSY